METEKRRARSEGDKAARRSAILRAAAGVFDAVELDAFTMEPVADALGLAKGTLYRYFPTREALLLALLEHELDGWFRTVDRSLATARDADGVSTRLVRTLLSRPRLLRLLAFLPSVLERNIPITTATAFKSFLLERTATTGALIDRALGAAPGAGAQLLVLLDASLVGLYHSAHPAPVVAEVLTDPRMAPLRVDLRRELTHVTRALAGAVPRKAVSP